MDEPTAVVIVPPHFPDRREGDIAWKKYITETVASLEQGHADLKLMVAKNNEMTELILSILAATKAFWNFLTKVSRIIGWIGRKTVYIAFAASLLYSCYDAIHTGHIAEFFKNFWKTDKLP